MENYLTEKTAKELLPKREQNSNKGTFGNVLNIAGSVNYRGAAFLSTKSVLKSGAGFVALASIETVINSVCKLCPEAVFISLTEKNGTIASCELEKIMEILPKYKVLSIGCGISSMLEDNIEIKTFVKDLFNKIKDIKISLVIDADGLNIISKLKITDLPKNSILTPHPMELSRLLNVDIKEIQKDRIKYAKFAAEKYHTVVILKGNKSIITDGEKVFVNNTGNSALAKAGSGDVLTGIISGFCAQGLIPFESAILGAYVHGLCGEFGSSNLSEYGVNASDLIDFIPKVIEYLINFTD